MSSAGSLFLDCYSPSQHFLSFPPTAPPGFGPPFEWPPILDIPEPMSWTEKWQLVFSEVVYHLDVADIIRLRRVCRFLYSITHQRALWAYHLRHAYLPSLPPLAPISETGPLEHGVPDCLSALAIESILVRGASLRANFARPNPRPLRVWAHETFTLVQDIVLLPGSEHLVAVQRNPKTRKCGIALYKLDCHHDAELMVALPLAGEPVTGTLVAKYMKVRGVMGMTVMCIQKLYAQHCNMAGIPGTTMAYESVASHLCLDTMEKLATVYPPDSPRYLWLSASLPPACTAIDMPAPSESALSAPALGMLFDKPCAVFAVESGPSTNEIWIQGLDGGKAVVKPVASPAMQYDFYNMMHWRIKAITILSEQQSVLVDSQYIMPSFFGDIVRPEPLAHKLEVFPVIAESAPHAPPPPTDPGVLVHHIAARGHQLRIAEPPAHIAPEHSLYAASGLAHAPGARHARTHVFVHAPLDDTPRNAAARPLPTVPPAGPLRVECYYDFDGDTADPVVRAELLHAGDDVRILPGARRPLLYKVARESMAPALGDACPERITSIHPYRRSGAGELEGELHCVVERLRFGGRDASVGAVAWDDTVGRLVVAHPERTAFKVFDFAKLPTLGSDGGRWPIRVD